MTQKSPRHSASFRWLGALLALVALVTAHFHATLIAAAVQLADAHGHEHQIVVRTDGNHLDVILSHRENPGTDQHSHEATLGFFATLLSSHEHEGDVHVLHFVSGDFQDQVKARSLAPPIGQKSLPVPTGVKMAVNVSPENTPAGNARPPPSPGLLGLRTVVLLI